MNAHCLATCGTSVRKEIRTTCQGLSLPMTATRLQNSSPQSCVQSKAPGDRGFLLSRTQGASAGADGSAIPWCFAAPRACAPRMKIARRAENPVVQSTECRSIAGRRLGVRSEIPPGDCSVEAAGWVWRIGAADAIPLERLTLFCLLHRKWTSPGLAPGSFLPPPGSSPAGSQAQEWGVRRRAAACRTSNRRSRRRIDPWRSSLAPARTGRRQG